MSGEVTSFEFQATGQFVRTVVRDGQPWFVGRDACDVIGISKYRDALAQLAADERASAAVDTLGGPQTMTVVSEAGLYALMLISRSPKVQQFRRWVTHEVLPAIRRTGRYEVAPRELTRLELIDLAREAEIGRLAAEARVAELAPAAEAYADLMEADGTYSMGAVANMVGIGRTILFATLRDRGVLQRDNRPYQRHAHHFKVVAQTYQAKGETRATYTTYVRPSGLDLIRRVTARPMQLVVSA